MELATSMDKFHRGFNLKDSIKVLLICTAFLIFYFALGVFNFSIFGQVNNTIDFFIHWNKLSDLSFHPEYPLLYHFVFQIFSQNQLLFYGANLLIICLIIPILLFLITKTHWSTVLYFCGISLPHVWLYGATFPQALVFMLILVYLANRKNPFVYLFCLFLASLLHRHGAYLFFLIFFGEIISWIITKIQEKYFPAVVLGTQKFDSFPVILFYLVTQISIPIFIFARKIFQNVFYLILAVVPVLFLNYDARLISVAQLSLLVVASPEIAKSKHKFLIGFILFFYLIFFLLEFAVGTTKLFLK